MTKVTSELIKIEGIGEITAKLLIQMGVNTPEKLATANAYEILEYLKVYHNNYLNEEKDTTKVSYLSEIETIQNWIDNAKKSDYKYTLAKIRYESLKERAYEEELRILIFNELILNKKIVLDFDNIKNVNTKEIKDKFKESFNDMAIVRKNNQTIKDWEARNKTKLLEFKKKYFEEFEQNLQYEEFKKFYGDDNTDRICHYCKVTENEIKELHKNGQIITKRFYSRGKSHEIDRTDPNGRYELENIKLCCYWCNNAKTDEFDENDFMPIGNEIGNVWKNRLIQNRK